MVFDFHHLKKVNVNYFSHALRAMRVSIILLSLGIAGIVHGLFPFIFVETVSKGIEKIADEMSSF